MSTIDKFPDLIKKAGRGKFSNKNHEFESHFEVLYFPEKTIITTYPKYSFNVPDIFDTWNLKGTTDDDLNIDAEKLLFSQNESDSITFTPQGQIQFSRNLQNKYKYLVIPLVGYYGGNIDLIFKNSRITVGSNAEHLKIQKEKSKLWNIQLEGSNLKIENSSLKTAELLKIASDISLLLSLATGNNVHFNRQIYQDNEDQFLFEIWKRKVGFNFGGQSCIEDFSINNFIETALPIIFNWTKEKKDTFLSIVNSINSSNYGYIEERLLSLCIGWESIINSWTKSKGIKNEDLKPLKNHLKKEIKAFNLPKDYDIGFITNRVINSLDWEKLNLSLENLLKSHNLNPGRLELDFKAIISIRNDIAHTGQFRKKYSKEFLVDLLAKHKQGLQIFLLKNLSTMGKLDLLPNSG